MHSSSSWLQALAVELTHGQSRKAGVGAGAGAGAGVDVDVDAQVSKVALRQWVVVKPGSSCTLILSIIPREVCRPSVFFSSRYT